jgi:sugar phosphate isomerase/epimerase
MTLVDLLEQRLESAKSYALECGLILFNGDYEDEDQGMVCLHWNSENKDFKKFIDVAKDLGVKVLVYDAKTYSEEQLRSYSSDIDELEDEERAVRLHNSLESMWGYCGHVSEIVLQFRHDGTLYIYEESADWAGEMEEILTEVDELIREQEQEQAS